MGRFFPGDSVIHRSDPRTKIVLTTIFMAVVFLLESVGGLLSLLAVCLMVAKKAGKPLKYTLRGLRSILCIALFALVLNLFFVSGTPLAPHGLLHHVSREGAALGVKMVMRLVLLVSGASLLTFTTSPLSLTVGLERLLQPLARLKLPVRETAMMMTVAMRFIPTILGEADRIFKSQASRSPGFHAVGGLSRVRGLMPMIVPLFVGSFRRGDELATAMEARCFSASSPRTRMKQLRFSGADLVSVSVTLALVTALMLFDYSVL